MIGLGSDHHGVVLKAEIRAFLEGRGDRVRDFGVFSFEPGDYPEVAALVAEAVARGEVERAVLICATGLGMAIAANKVPGVYAVTVCDTYSAHLARESNNANVLALGEALVAPELACRIVDAWLSAEFHGGDSARKLGKIREMEQRYAGGVPPLRLDRS